MKLGIGTAQFGLNYGVSNRDGMTPQAEVERILALAAAAGIDYLDTAPAYGRSESCLGAALRGGGPFQIVTKTPACDGDTIQPSHADALRLTFLRSLENLRVDRVYGLLVHHAGDVMKPGGGLLLEVMRELAQQGLVQKLGISVYDGAEIDAVLEIFVPQIVQCPLNIFDQRLLASGHLAKLQGLGAEVHLRSVFLQGLLLMEPDAMPGYFLRHRPLIEDFSRFVAGNQWTKLQCALSFALAQTNADAVMLGITTAAELSEILGFASNTVPANLDFSRFAVNDPDLVDPSRWRLAS